MNHYIGFDIHKKTISYCVKLNDGKILEEGVIAATRSEARGLGCRTAGTVGGSHGSDHVHRMGL